MSSACVCHIPNEVCWYCEALKARHERWEFEKELSEIHSQLTKALQTLSWYADETKWIQGRYEGMVFFSLAEDDKGLRARELLNILDERDERKCQKCRQQTHIKYLGTWLCVEHTKCGDVATFASQLF